MTDHADTIRPEVEGTVPSQWWLDLKVENQRLRAERQQAIDALREIAKPRHTWSELDFEQAQETARAALLSLGEQP